jgi:hypothetical protein
MLLQQAPAKLWLLRLSAVLMTVNTGYTLSDGGNMLLTTAVQADRNKNKKGGLMPPDVVEGDQEVIDAAVEWLNEP